MNKNPNKSKAINTNFTENNAKIKVTDSNVGKGDLKFDENSDENSDEINKFNELYSEILKLLVDKKLFLDKDLNINSLAMILKTNTSYISKAINISTSDNFNNIVNLYRIEYFKDLVKNSEYKSYKLQYLYSEAGFNSQSSFNRAFKKLENKSPSEYMIEIQNL